MLRWHDQVASNELFVTFSGYCPLGKRFVVTCCGDPCLELNRGSLLESVRDVIQVAEDLGLAWVSLRPHPFVLKIGIETV